MKGNQNPPNRQVTSNNMTGKPLQFSHRSKNNSREHLKNYDIEVQINSHNVTQNITTEIATSYHRLEVVHYTQDHQNHKIPLTIILDHNLLTIIELEIVHDDHSCVIDFVTSKFTLTRF